MNIFVGNLSFGAKEADVYKAFAAFGTVGIVAIVMEKKGKKSRGFGFVEMPEEQEALAAIAALHGKELLGRPLNVMPALPKKSKSESLEKRRKPEVKRQEDLFRAKPPGNSRHDPSFIRTGRYKEGRRSLSFMKRRSEAGVVEAMPARKYKDNPMRWRKKPRWSKPFGKTDGETKPWQKHDDKSRTWKKTEGGQSRSGQKTEGAPKPWQKYNGKPKTWVKTEGVSKPWQKHDAKPGTWKKTEGGQSRPGKRTEGVSKPWRKSSEGAPKPWVKRRGSAVSHKR